MYILYVLDKFLVISDSKGKKKIFELIRSKSFNIKLLLYALRMAYYFFTSFLHKIDTKMAHSCRYNYKYFTCAFVPSTPCLPAPTWILQEGNLYFFQSAVSESGTHKRILWWIFLGQTPECVLGGGFSCLASCIRHKCSRQQRYIYTLGIQIKPSETRGKTRTIRPFSVKFPNKKKLHLSKHACKVVLEFAFSREIPMNNSSFQLKSFTNAPLETFLILFTLYGGSRFSTGVIFLRVRHVRNRPLWHFFYTWDTFFLRPGGHFSMAKNDP